jgi:hypothetical protein
MNDMDQRINHANKVMKNLTKKQMEELSQKDIDRSKRDFDKLKAGLEQGLCCYCNQSVDTLVENQPCLHWLLNPRGFKKKYLPKIYGMKKFHEIQAYLRWVANSELLIRNINDWTEERSSSKVIEETIIYKNLEWSFSCSHNDLEGHHDKTEGRYPHYHFQMKVDGKVIINYGGFHIPFHEHDMFIFAVKDGRVPGMSFQHTQSSGIQKMFDKYSPEELLELMNTKNMEEGQGKQQFHLQTVVHSPNGISGKKIAELQKRHEETGVPMAKLLQELEGATVITTIEPGEDIPEIAKRKSR